MSTPAHPVFAANEPPPDNSWAVAEEVFSTDSDEVQNTSTDVEWEQPYLDMVESPTDEDSIWEEDNFGDGNEFALPEQSWPLPSGEHNTVEEEVGGAGYEHDYEERDWPQEAPPLAASLASNTVVIADYPRYATKVSELRPDQVASLRSIANGIVGAFLAGQQVSVIVEGFADFDAKGRDFEQQVSIDRAISARSFLVEEVHKIALAVGLSFPILKHFSAQSVGFGSRRPSVRYPKTEDERRQNRRIHVLLSTVPRSIPGIPPLHQVLDRAERSLAQITAAGPKRRTTCLIQKLRDSKAADGYFSYEALKMFPGSAGWPAMSSDQFDRMVKATTLHARPHIRSIAAAARSDLDMARQLEALDDNIGRNIFNFEQQFVGDSTTGVLMRTFNATIGRLQLDPTSILSCYPGYARLRHDQ